MSTLEFWVGEAVLLTFFTVGFCTASAALGWLNLTWVEACDFIGPAKASRKKYRFVAFVPGVLLAAVWMFLVHDELDGERVWYVLKTLFAKGILNGHVVLAMNYILPAIGSLLGGFIAVRACSEGETQEQLDYREV